MKEVKGTILAVENEDHNGFEKKIITLGLGQRDMVFIEFRGHSSELVSNALIGKRVSVKIRFIGKESRLGRKYNNIIAKSIKTL